MSMKSYHEDAKASEKSVLSRRGFSPKENEPDGLIARSQEIGGFAERKPSEAEKRASGGKIDAKPHGAKAHPRMDRFARGGHVKSKGKTTVNVVIAGQPSGAPPRPVPVPVPVPGPSAGTALPSPNQPPPRPLPPTPPVAAGPGAMPPPGMAPMRKRGGAVDKEDCDGDMVKRAFGGSVGGRGKDGPDAPAAPKDAGAGSGVGRMEKNGRRARAAA